MHGLQVLLRLMPGAIGDELKEVLLAATPDQLAELHAISEVFDISMDEVCTEVLKLILSLIHI